MSNHIAEPYNHSTVSSILLNITRYEDEFIKLIYRADIVKKQKTKTKKKQTKKKKKKKKKKHTHTKKNIWELFDYSTVSKMHICCEEFA